MDVVHLGYGEPDFAPPAVVQQALDRALADGKMRYTHSLGILPLREAIADHYRATYGVKVSPDQVLVTPGTSPAMLLLFGALLDPGDEVVLSDPYYACYPNFIRYADGVPVYVDTTEEDGFQYRPEAIQSRLGPRTRAIVINSPANPTGAVLSPERMAAIAALAREDGPWIVADEIYHGLTDGGRDRSILEFTDRAFVLNGFSKAFAMTGWRLGWRDRAGQATCARCSGSTATSSSRPTSSCSGRGSPPCARRRTRRRASARIFAARRRMMIDGLRALGFGVGFEPTGAFYILANARQFSGDSVRFAYEILDQCHVAVTPGVAFGAQRRRLSALLVLRVGRAHPGRAAPARCVPGPAAVSAEPCPACSKQWPADSQRIIDCGTSVAYLHDDQFFPGWTFLVLKRHATELWQLDQAERAQLIEEVTRVARAVATAFGAVKMNYELLGNQIAHIHWHLIPRPADDPAPRQPVWMVDHEPRRLAPAAFAARIALIRSHLGA